MIVNSFQNLIEINQERLSTPEFINKINADFSLFSNNNIIVILVSLIPLTRSELSEFLLLSNTHRENGHSFVIVTNNVDIDSIPEELIVVPTLIEAKDVVEMEEMERDLNL
ncbi:MAG: ribonuclease Z [Flavobacteriaceae bacterium]